MTTPDNTPTRSTANAHEGQTAADTNFLERYFSPRIPCTYTRKKVLAEGLQQEVSPEYLRLLEKDWDMHLTDHPIYLTKRVIETCQIPDQRVPDEEKGRLWDLLNVLDFALDNSLCNPIDFPVSFGAPKAKPDVTLRAVWTTVDIDNPTSAITVKMPDED